MTQKVQFFHEPQLEYPDLFQLLYSIFEIIDAAFILPVRLIPVGFTYATYGALTITAVTLFGIFKYTYDKTLISTYLLKYLPFVQ